MSKICLDDYQQVVDEFGLLHAGTCFLLLLCVHSKNKNKEDHRLMGIANCELRTVNSEKVSHIQSTFGSER